MKVVWEHNKEKARRKPEEVPGTTSSRVKRHRLLALGFKIRWNVATRRHPFFDGKERRLLCEFCYTWVRYINPEGRCNECSLKVIERQWEKLRKGKVK